MTPQDPAVRAKLIAELGEASREQVRGWLSAVLRGQRMLPDHAHDEPPYLAVLRLEPALSSPTRRDLAAACVHLVGELCERYTEDPDYAAGLLALAAELRLYDITGALVACVRDFPRRPGLPLALKKRVVGTLLELRVRQPAEFWQTLLESEPALEGGAFAGLLRSDRDAALAALPRLPERQSLADAVTLTLEHATAEMSTLEREVFLPRLLDVRERCAPLLRATLDEWLEEVGLVATAAKPDLYTRLRGALARRIPGYQPAPARARLAPA